MAHALVLVVPGLLALPAAQLAATRSLATLGGYAGAPHSHTEGIAAALFTALGVAPTTPVAPLALLGAGGDPGADYVLCADPVHLVADRDTVVLAQVIDDLPAGDADVLVRMLDRHFADDDLRFEAVRPDAWFARRRQPARIATTPPDVARGRNLVAHLPRGSDSGTWKRWQDEIEMLLHEHPVNAAREARREPAANAVWFWGGGRLAEVGRLPPAIVTAPDTRLGAVAHGIARHGAPAAPRIDDDLSHALARAARHGAAAVVVLAVLPPVAGDLRAVDATWLAPALALLAARRIASLHVVADGNGAAATWTARPPGLWQRVAARASRHAFEIPSPPDA